MQKITTKTGSYYEIKGGRWRKNGSGHWETVWHADCVDRAEIASLGELRDAPRLPIQLGKSLYIGSMDAWWLSTEIVKIEEWDDSED